MNDEGHQRMKCNLGTPQSGTEQHVHSCALGNIYIAVTIINAACWFSTFRVNLRESVMDLVVAAECPNVNLTNLTMRRYS